MMSIETLKEVAPAAFAIKPMVGVSESKYTFIPTHQIITDLAKLGWEVHSGRQQSTKHEDRVNAVKHVLHFRNPEFNAKQVGDTLPEIMIVNSHDRTSSFRFYIGMHRLVCSNGLVIKTGSLEEISIPHIRYTFDYVAEQVQLLTTKVPEVLARIDDFRKISLDEAAKMALAERALTTRFDEYLNLDGSVNVDMIHKDINMDEFLSPKRTADADSSLWSTFNLVQEKVLKGGWRRETEKSRLLHGQKTEKGYSAKSDRRVRPLTNIGKSIQVNQDLWEIADNYALTY